MKDNQNWLLLDILMFQKIDNATGLQNYSRNMNIQGWGTDHQFLVDRELQKHMIFQESDIWAFGVLVWEISSLGGVPYSSVNIQDIENYIRLER